MNKEIKHKRFWYVIGWLYLYLFILSIILIMAGAFFYGPIIFNPILGNILFWSGMGILIISFLLQLISPGDNWIV